MNRLQIICSLLFYMLCDCLEVDIDECVSFCEEKVRIYIMTLLILNIVMVTHDNVVTLCIKRPMWPIIEH